MTLVVLFACAGTKDQPGTETGVDSRSDSETPVDSAGDTGTTPTESSTDSDSATETGTTPPAWARWSGTTALPSGFTLTGESASQGAGSRVDAGDVNADGAVDVLVTAPFGKAGGTAWLVHGPVVADALLADSTTRFTAAGTGMGFSGRLVRDLDGDGGMDVLLGDYGHELTEPAVYVLPGGTLGTVDAAGVPGRWYGEEPYDKASADLMDVGDITGDGRHDLVVGAPFYAGEGRGGAAYVLPQPEMAGGFLGDADTRIDGEVGGAWLGFGLARLGDINADGVDDLGVMVEGDVPDPGLRVFFGPLSGALLGSDADAFLVSDGDAHGGAAQGIVAGGSDIDGDGVPDVVVGCPRWGEGTGDPTGQAAVISGARVTGRVDLRTPDAMINGNTEYGGVGGQVALPGDLDGDGRGDLLLGSGQVWGGTAYGGYFLYYGALSGNLAITDADAAWIGTNETLHVGYAIGGGRDLDGDGAPDLWLGADQARGETTNTGAAYVIPNPG